MKELWVEKYRPKTVDGYVFRDEHQKAQVKQWIKEQTIPHLLFSGNAGIGKTTLAKLLFNELEINDLHFNIKPLFFIKFLIINYKLFIKLIIINLKWFRKL